MAGGPDIAKVRVEHGDCLDVMARLADEGLRVDGVITDAPYHLASIVERLGSPDAAPIQSGKTGAYARASAGFMGQQWDGGDIAFRPETWRLVFALMKPGAHLVAFSATRTYHRMACAIEDAGFEIRDQIGWLYGTGFPKSHNLDGEWDGWGTALKPAWEPIVLARKPLLGSVPENMAVFGTGAINIDGCRIPAVAGDEPMTWAGEASLGFRNNSIGQYAGKGDAEQRSSTKGRWPANVVHDGSDEVLAAFAEYGQRGACAPVKGTEPSDVTAAVYGKFKGRVPGAFHGDSGTAERFFYSAKATDAERIVLCTECGVRSFGKPRCAHDAKFFKSHPTVKPIELMRWLVRMVTPPGGLVLDPFAGTGTTGAAAIAEGCQALLIEREAPYVADICHRLGLSLEDARRTVVAARPVSTDGLGPLFDTEAA